MSDLRQLSKSELIEIIREKNNALRHIHNIVIIMNEQIVHKDSRDIIVACIEALKDSKP